MGQFEKFSENPSSIAGAFKHEEHVDIPIMDVTLMQIDLIKTMGMEKNEDTMAWAEKYRGIFRNLIDENPNLILEYHSANAEKKKEMLAKIKELMEARFAQSVH